MFFKQTVYQKSGNLFYTTISDNSIKNPVAFKKPRKAEFFYFFSFCRNRKNGLANTKTPIKMSNPKQTRKFPSQIFLIASSLTGLARLVFLHREPLIIRSIFILIVGTKWIGMKKFEFDWDTRCFYICEKKKIDNLNLGVAGYHENGNYSCYFSNRQVNPFSAVRPSHFS